MKRNKLPKLKSDPPEKPISDKVAFLVEKTDLNLTSAQIIKLSKAIQANWVQGYYDLIEVDKNISGVGLHNVHRPVGNNEMSGNYRIEFRPQFRPIQYVYQKLSYDNLEWTARDIVSNSCLHVEYAIKLRFNIPENINESLGQLLFSEKRRQNVEGELNSNLLLVLKELNRFVYREAKHTIEHTKLDSHNFSPADAIGVYLVCRWIGVKLLEPIGIFDRWMRS